MFRIFVQGFMFRSVWNYRNFIYTAIKGELKGRFARSRIGAAWFLLHPLALATIYAVVLAEVLAAKVPGVENRAGYAVYLMAGMASWNLFAEITNRCTNIFIEYAASMKKISFPRLCLPIIVGGSALLNHVLLLGAMIFVFLFFGQIPGSAWLTLPIAMALIAAIAFGLGILLGIFNTFARDVGQVFAIVLQFWFWVTPVVYTINVLPEGLRRFTRLNPLVPLVKTYQDALLLNRWPDPHAFLFPLVVAIVLVAVALFVFRRASAELVDAL